MKIISYGLSHVGMKRSQNEDHYLLNDELKLYVVADGMGGHLGGEFASRMAVTTIEEVIEAVSQSEATVVQGVNSEDVSYGERLSYAIRVAGRRIYEQSLYDETLKGMGTTTVSVLIQEENLKAYIAHVGDSRGYLIRQGNIRQLTEDHSLVSEQVKAGLISAEEMKGHRLKNIITRSVGYQQDVETDLSCCDLLEGDQIFLCSDGLSNLIDSSEICRVAKTGSSLQEVCEELIQMANDRGGDDNITVVLIKIV